MALLTGAGAALAGEAATHGGRRRAGLARQLCVAALAACRGGSDDVEPALATLVEAARAAGLTTAAGLRKSASEARAMLQYGEGDVGSLAAASDVAEALRCAAQIVNAMKPREVLARRAQALNGQRGGRPPGETFRVLSAVARLKASAGHGDRRAEVELKLLRTFLLEA